jgi:hypothetical protein
MTDDPTKARLTDLHKPFPLADGSEKVLEDWTAEDFHGIADRIGQDRAAAMATKMERSAARTVGEMIEREGRR